MVVAMMAAVGCVENGLVGMERISKRESYDLSNYCKKNGIENITFLTGSSREMHGLKCPEHSHSFGTPMYPSQQSSVGGGGIGQSEEEEEGGTSAIVFAKPSIPSLRSRQQRTAGPNVMKNKTDPDDSSKDGAVSRNDSPGVRTRRRTGEGKPPSSNPLHNNHHHHHQQQKQQQKYSHHHTVSAKVTILSANFKKDSKDTNNRVRINGTLRTTTDITATTNPVINNNNNILISKNTKTHCQNNNHNTTHKRSLRKISGHTNTKNCHRNNSTLSPKLSTSTYLHNNKHNLTLSTNNNNLKSKRRKRISVLAESFPRSSKMGVLCADRNCDKEPCGCQDISTGSPRPASLPSSALSPTSPTSPNNLHSTRKRSLDSTTTSSDAEPSFKSARRRVHRTPSVGSIFTGGNGNNHTAQLPGNPITTRAGNGYQNKLSLAKEKDAEDNLDNVAAVMATNPAKTATISFNSTNHNMVPTRPVRCLNGFKLTNGLKKIVGEKLRLISTPSSISTEQTKNGNHHNSQYFNNHQKSSGDSDSDSYDMLPVTTCLSRIKNSLLSSALLTPSPSSSSPSSSSSSSSSFIFQNNDCNKSSNISVSDNNYKVHGALGKECIANSVTTTITTTTTKSSSTCSSSSGSSITNTSKGSNRNNNASSNTTVLSNRDSNGHITALNDIGVSSSSCISSVPLPSSSPSLFSHSCSKLTRQSSNAQGNLSPLPPVSSGSISDGHCNNRSTKNCSFSSVNSNSAATTTSVNSSSVTRCSPLASDTVPNLRQRSTSGGNNNINHDKSPVANSQGDAAGKSTSFSSSKFTPPLSSSLSMSSLSLLHKQNGISKAKSSLSSSSSSSSTSSSSSLSTTKSLTAPSDSAVPKQIECKWRGCSFSLDPSDLLDHVRKHAETQISKKKYACLWTDCKVYNQPALSGSWLERHIVSHSGHRPFKCIVPKCGQRFHSQMALERHVNSHFASTAANGASKSGRTREEITLQKRRKQMKRRFAQSVKTSDFFDEDTMTVIKQQVQTLTQLTHIGMLDHNPLTVTFTGTVVGRRSITKTGSKQALVDFNPPDVLEDQWLPHASVSEEDLNEMCVPIALLPHDTVTRLHTSLYRRHRFRKHRRK